MRKILYKKCWSARFAFLILIMFSLIAVSCTVKKKKSDAENLIPEKDLVSILEDIHLADGLLSLPQISSRFSSLDSIEVYYKVIEKHGYTKEKMDKTMKYYFINDPKKLNEIYDKVLGILSERESRIENETYAERMRNTNLWPGKEFYSIPGYSVNDSSYFDKTLNMPGIYTLTFTLTLFPDDQSINPGASAYSCSPDSLLTGKRKYVKSLNFIKDGRPHTYKLVFMLRESKMHRIKGWLFDFRSKPYKLENHVKIENISLIFNAFAVS
jgi:hypothetical protein